MYFTKMAAIVMLKFLMVLIYLTITSLLQSYNSTNFNSEKDYFVAKEYDPKVQITTEDSCVYLEITLEKNIFAVKTQIQTTDTLGTVRIVNALYENKDGGILQIDADINSVPRKNEPTPGPIETLVLGYNKIKVWE